MISNNKKIFYTSWVSFLRKILDYGASKKMITNSKLIYNKLINKTKVGALRSVHQSFSVIRFTADAASVFIVITSLVYCGYTRGEDISLLASQFCNFFVFIFDSFSLLLFFSVDNSRPRKLLKMYYPQNFSTKGTKYKTQEGIFVYKIP